MRRLTACCTVLLVAGFASRASAKDLTGRVGVGYVQNLISNPATGGTGALSARYWVNESIGLEGDLGFNLISPKGGDAQNTYAVQLGGMYSFVDEPNLHVYGDLNAAFGSVPVFNAAATPPTTDNKTALGVNAGMGMEFFFVGLPNLGFATNVGISFVQVSDIGSQVTLGGADYATLGIRYYFGGPKGPPGGPH